MPEGQLRSHPHDASRPHSPNSRPHSGCVERLSQALNAQCVERPLAEWIETQSGTLEVTAACFAERSQLRCTTRRTPSPSAPSASDAGGESLEHSFEALDRVARTCLTRICNSVHDLDVTPYYDSQSSVLDLFHYSPERCPWDTPCPAHVDKGFVTLIADTVSGLEIKAGEDWLPVNLEENQVALIVNR